MISSECGWRFIEAAPEDLSDKLIYGFYKQMTHFSNGDRLSDTQVFSGSRRDGVGLGKSNTEKIVEKMDIDGLAYSVYGNNKTTEKYAAKECMDYSIVGIGLVLNMIIDIQEEKLFTVITPLLHLASIKEIEN